MNVNRCDSVIMHHKLRQILINTKYYTQMKAADQLVGQTYMI
jgi:hypothetical protein